MKIILVIPDDGNKLIGNRITGRRYARIFRRLGHTVQALSGYSNERCDLMVALHARRSHAAIREFRRQHPKLPLVVVLTGTDLYRDIRNNGDARKSLDMATRLVVLQEKGRDMVPAHLQRRVRVIYQSAGKTRSAVTRPGSQFKVAVIGNIREEKDPWRTAAASRLLPPESRVRIVHVGKAPDPRDRAFARREQRDNFRYRWAGELPHWKALRVLASSHLASITSRMEGGSNVLVEALSAGVPVVATRIPGLVGTLGESYPGYFPVGDTRALSELLFRAERDAEFYRSLQKSCAGASTLVRPARETGGWRQLFSEIVT